MANRQVASGTEVEADGRVDQRLGRVICVIGTRAQVIKMAPVLLELERTGTPFCLYLTGQHESTIAELLAEFGIVTIPVHLYRGTEVKRISGVIPWFIVTAWRLWRSRKSWCTDGATCSIILVHGDTFSTVMGALIGRIAGARVAHVEAGLRSFSLRDPFPEELNRVITTWLCQIGYCPGEWAQENLRGKRIEAVNTHSNTLLDALRIAIGQSDDQECSESPYVVFSIHRFENLYSAHRIDFILGLAKQIAQNTNVLFVLHPATRWRLERLDKLAELEAEPGIRLLPRMTYQPFIRLAASARLIVTDGGSNQEELAYLNIPTLLMRRRTERQEGLGSNVMLARYDQTCVDAFVARALETEDSDRRIQVQEDRPSAIIVQHLRDELAH